VQACRHLFSAGAIAQCILLAKSAESSKRVPAAQAHYPLPEGLQIIDPDEKCASATLEPMDRNYGKGKGPETRPWPCRQMEDNVVLGTMMLANWMRWTGLVLGAIFHTTPNTIRPAFSG